MVELVWSSPSLKDLSFGITSDGGGRRDLAGRLEAVLVDSSVNSRLGEACGRMGNVIKHAAGTISSWVQMRCFVFLVNISLDPGPRRWKQQTSLLPNFTLR
eukprot:scaffold155183_cov70-Cyclotella_meneghiniana.AAC.4